MSSVVVSEQAVRDSTDGRSFERGQAYFAAGRVRRFTADGTTVTAMVDGTRRYRVQVEIARTGLHGRCTCPYGAEGAFCKHCVAVALTWLEKGGTVGEPRTPRPEPMSDARLRTFLLGQDRAWVADQLLAAARRDVLVRAQLEVAAGADPRGAYDDRDLRARLERAVEIDADGEGAEAYLHVEEVTGVLDDVVEVMNGGFPDAAIGLAEYALDLLDGVADRMDDLDTLGELLDRAEDVHLAACMTGEPDPVALAERLVAHALASDHDVFVDALADYEAVLGPAGTDRYRELVEQAWAALSPEMPREFDGRRSIVTHLMEELAKHAGTR